MAGVENAISKSVRGQKKRGETTISDRSLAVFYGGRRAAQLAITEINGRSLKKRKDAGGCESAPILLENTVREKTTKPLQKGSEYDNCTLSDPENDLPYSETGWSHRIAIYAIAWAGSKVILICCGSSSAAVAAPPLDAFF